MSVFIYVQKIDAGLAPCVHRGVWSLALCKPTIRRRAKAGDVVIAVTPAADGHRLSSWARIEKQIDMETFSNEYPKTRLDNIYEKGPDGVFARRATVKHDHHNTHQDRIHDLGKKGESAVVLISRDFYAFGESAIDFSKWTRGLLALRKEIEKLGRAFRRYFDADVESDLTQLEALLKEDFSRFHNSSFKPRDPGLKLPCESRAEERKFSHLGKNNI